MRQLIYGGAPEAQIYGSDYEEGLIRVGKDFFRDTDKIKSEFVTSDIFDTEAPGNKAYVGKFDYIWTAMFFHLWDWDMQVKASVQTAKFLKDEKGATLFGWQRGAKPAVEVDKGERDHTAKHRFVYRHDEESFQKLWKEVGHEMGLEFDVKSMGAENEHTRGLEENLKGSTDVFLVFKVTRI